MKDHNNYNEKADVRCTDDEFVTLCGISNAEGAHVALAFRKAIAEVTHYPVESIVPTMSFKIHFPFLNDLDSLDAVRFSVCVEKYLGWSITSKQMRLIPGLDEDDREDPRLLVKDLILGAIEVLDKK